MESTTLVNRVAESGIITFNLEDYFPKAPFIIFDIKEYLFHGLILKEKDFREALKSMDWTPYQGKIVLVNCSTDAIIPLWAYMLINQHLSNVASDIYNGSQEEYLKMYYREVLQKIDYQQYKDHRVVIKGCSNRPVPANAYAYITSMMLPFAQSIMFGEPCSTVPIFKRPRVLQKQ